MVSLQAALTPELASSFTDLKMKQLYAYLIFKVDGKVVALEYAGKHKTEIEDKQARQKEEFADFVAHMPKDQARYAIFDMEVHYPDGHNSPKIVFFHYCPDIGKTTDKVLYSGSKGDVKKQFGSFEKEFQVNNHADLILAKCIESFLGGKVI
jgi:hypothetical protein